MVAPLYTRDILRLAASLDEPALLDRVDGVIFAAPVFYILVKFLSS